MGCSLFCACPFLAVDVLVLGFANLVADGISMGFGDYVSSSTEKDVAAKERTVTEWDVLNHHRPQKQELLRHYQELGMNDTDANTVCFHPILECSSIFVLAASFNQYLSVIP